jgi:hypothetical protein
MRLLAQPKVLGAAVGAAALTALACYPRLSHAPNPVMPVWYLACAIFCCCIVLWAFVFAWHTPYTGRPVWVFKPGLKLVIFATLTGIALAAIDFWLVDPLLKARLPDEFPADRQQWIERVLFSLSMTQLFILFAPFDWLMRLIRNQKIAAGLTILFGCFIMTIHMQSLSAVPLPLFAALLIGRAFIGGVAIFFYLRGGILMVWWLSLLLQMRFLLELK